MHFNIFDTDINDFVPSSLNPRSARKETSTQNTCRLSLSLKKNSLHKSFVDGNKIRTNLFNVTSISDINDNEQFKEKSDMVRMKFTPKNSHCSKCQLPNPEGVHLSKCNGPLSMGKECQAGDKCCSCVENHYRIFKHEKLKNFHEQNGDKGKTNISQNNNYTNVVTKDNNLLNQIFEGDSSSSAISEKLFEKDRNPLPDRNENEKTEMIQNWVESYYQNVVVNKNTINDNEIPAVNNQVQRKRSSASSLNDESESSVSDVIITKKRRSVPIISQTQVSRKSSVNGNNRYNTRLKSKKNMIASKTKQTHDEQSKSENSLNTASSDVVFSPKKSPRKKIPSSTECSPVNSNSISLDSRKILPEKENCEDQQSNDGKRQRCNSNASTVKGPDEPKLNERVRIKLTGDCILGKEIILEVEFGLDDGWAVNCTSKGNVVDFKDERIKNVFNVDITINSDKQQMDSTYQSIDSKKSIKQEMDNKEFKKEVLKAIDEVKNTTITDTLFSSCESIFPEKKGNVTIKTADKIRALIDSDEEVTSEKNLEKAKLNSDSSFGIGSITMKKAIRLKKKTAYEMKASIDTTVISDDEESFRKSDTSSRSATTENSLRLKIKTAEEINALIDDTIVVSDEDEPSQTNLKKPTEKRKRKVCPKFKIIEGAPFAVDAFNYGVLQGVDFYFLTHFHSDHYVGLTKKFSKPLYCSQITANLLNLKIKLDKKYINILQLNTPVMINNVEVTALDANHCPGSIMLLFKFQTGQNILHTGDFRAIPEMELYPELQNINFDKLYLDTTYCKKQYSFPSQEDSIADATEIAKKWLTTYTGKKTLIVVGTYLIGKERMWLGLCENLSKKVWIDKSRLELILAFQDENYTKYLEKDPKEAEIHVIPLQDLSQDKLVSYLKKYEDKFDRILAIRPSGWEHKKKPHTRGAITIAGVPYSEHSSYSELQNFVRFLKPTKIIPTAGNENQLSKFYKDCGLKDPSINTIDKYFAPSQE